MPLAAIGVGLGTALAGGAAAGATIYGARKQAQATNRAAAMSERGLQEQIAFERERDAEARRQWEAVEARRAPFREAADAVLRKRAQQLGIEVAPRQASVFPGTAANAIQQQVGGQIVPSRQLQPDPVDRSLGAIAQRRRI